jgi:hypothetical protein
MIGSSSEMELLDESIQAGQQRLVPYRSRSDVRAHFEGLIGQLYGVRRNRSLVTTGC